MNKTKKLKYSKPFKDSLWSEFEEVDNLVSKLLEEIQAELNLERFNKSKYKSNLKVLLLNLFVTYSVFSKMYLAVPRGSGDFSTSRYNSNNIGYKVFIKIFNALTKLIPAKRMCSLNDVVLTLESLLKNKSNYLTGQNILVDDGRSIV